MKWLSRLAEPGLRAFMSLAYILLCLSALTNILLAPVPFLQYAGIGLACYVLLRLCTGSRPGRVAGIVTLSVSVLGLLFLMLDKGAIHKAFLAWMGDFGRAWEKLYYFEPLAGSRYASYQPVILVLLAALTAFVAWFFHERRFRFLPLVGYAMACLLLSFEMAAKEARAQILPFIVLSVCLLAGSVYERRRREGVENPDSGAGRIMLQAVPVAVVALLLTFLFEKPDEPLRWKWLETKVNDLYTRIEEKFTHTDTEFFSLSATGLSGREHLLGGRVRLSNTLVMEVKADKRAYLRGAAYQNYTGTSWMLVDPQYDYQAAGYPESAQDLDELGGLYRDVPLSLLYPSSMEPGNARGEGTGTPVMDTETAALVERLATGELDPLLFPTLPMEVTFRNFTTRTLLTPLKTVLPVKGTDGGALPVTENSRGILVSSQFLGSGSRYTFSYRQPMYGDEILQKLLPLSHAGLYELALRTYLDAWNELDTLDAGERSDPQVQATYGRLLTPNLVDDKGDPLPDQSFETGLSYWAAHPDPLTTPAYQQLSQWYQRATEVRKKYTTLPDTVTERTRQFAQALTEGMVTDYDRVLAVRDALRELYPYTLVMPRLPEGEDFVDWFLFENRSGYCTSYASAMTVLLRTLGIPARYVEGYVLPEKEKEEDLYRVTNRFAHAWVEVYFEGFGWLSFEPTPGFAGTTDFLAQSVNDMSGSYDGGYMPDLEELMRRYGGNRDDLGLEDGDLGPVEVRKPLPPQTIALLVLGALLALLLLLDIGSRVTEAVRIGRSPGRRQVVARYGKMLEWLALTGMTLEPGESLTEFAGRVDNEYYFPESSFAALSALFGRVRYGAKEPTRTEVRLMKAMGRELRAQLVRELGIRRVMPLRHLLLRI